MGLVCAVCARVCVGWIGQGRERDTGEVNDEELGETLS